MNAATTPAETRPACFMVCAPKGDRRAARGVIGRAIRSVIGARRARGSFTKEWSEDDGVRHSGQFWVDVSDDECRRVCQAVVRECGDEWSQPPVEVFHD